MNAAVRSSGFLFPSYKIVCNLAPADIRKAGAMFDLALALTILGMDQQIDAARLRDVVCLGELALDGSVKSVPGVLPSAIGIKRAGYRRLMLPEENLAEAALVDGLSLHPSAHVAASGRCRARAANLPCVRARQLWVLR